MLVRKNYLRMTVFISWSEDVVYSKIPVFLGLINLEEKVFPCDHLVVCLACKSLLVKLVFKVVMDQLTLDNLVNPLLDPLHLWDVR